MGTRKTETMGINLMDSKNWKRMATRQNFDGINYRLDKKFLNFDDKFETVFLQDDLNNIFRARYREIDEMPVGRIIQKILQLRLKTNFNQIAILNELNELDISSLDHKEYILWLEDIEAPVSA